MFCFAKAATIRGPFDLLQTSARSKGRGTRRAFCEQRLKLMQGIDNEGPTRAIERSCPLKSEIEMSKPWHGVNHVEIQANANRLSEPESIHHFKGVASVPRSFGSQRLHHINARGTRRRQSGGDDRSGEQHERRGDDGNHAGHANVRDVAASQAGEHVS